MRWKHPNCAAADWGWCIGAWHVSGGCPYPAKHGTGCTCSRAAMCQLALASSPLLAQPFAPHAEPNVVALYEKLGFVADPDGIRGVAYQSKLAQQLQMTNGRRR